MPTKDQMLSSYSKHQSKPGKPHKPSTFDEKCAEIAETYTEEELRGAVVMRATFNRSLLEKKRDL